MPSRLSETAKALDSFVYKLDQSVLELALGQLLPPHGGKLPREDLVLERRQQPSFEVSPRIMKCDRCCVYLLEDFQEFLKGGCPLSCRCVESVVEVEGSILWEYYAQDLAGH